MFRITQAIVPLIFLALFSSCGPTELIINKSENDDLINSLNISGSLYYLQDDKLKKYSFDDQEFSDLPIPATLVRDFDISGDGTELGYLNEDNDLYVYNVNTGSISGPHGTGGSEVASIKATGGWAVKRGFNIIEHINSSITLPYLDEPFFTDLVIHDIAIANDNTIAYLYYVNLGSTWGDKLQILAANGDLIREEAGISVLDGRVFISRGAEEVCVYDDYAHEHCYSEASATSFSGCHTPHIYSGERADGSMYATALNFGNDPGDDIILRVCVESVGTNFQDWIELETFPSSTPIKEMVWGE